MENDAATTALTGQLPFIVFTGAVIAFPLSLYLLKRYKVAVLRTMAASGGAAPTPGGVPDGARRASDAGQLETVMVDVSSVPPPVESDGGLSSP